MVPAALFPGPPVLVRWSFGPGSSGSLLLWSWSPGPFAPWVFVPGAAWLGLSSRLQRAVHAHRAQADGIGICGVSWTLLKRSASRVFWGER